MLTRNLILFLLLGFSKYAWAFGGTAETWLGGTQPWDSVPAEELNLGLEASSSKVVAPFVELGVFDQVMLNAKWRQPIDSSPGSGELGIKVRELIFPRWRPAMAAYVRSGFGNQRVGLVPGLIFAFEPWDQSLVANLEAGLDGVLFRCGYWTPYLVSFIRIGFEGVLDSRSDVWKLLPQITFQAPGDISAVFGAETFADSSGRLTWLMRLSYQLFPSP